MQPIHFGGKYDASSILEVTMRSHRSLQRTTVPLPRNHPTNTKELPKQEPSAKAEIENKRLLSG